MASAVFEALEVHPEFINTNIRVLPGITAMLAAAAAAGAPLGHDFCAINLSDNLKPWEMIEHRFIYRPHVEMAFVDSVERRSAEMHIARMIRRGEASEVGPGSYRAV